MIQKVIIRRFKRFREETFILPGHIVLAGPNNMGKTTILQAIAAWSLALQRWRQLNHFHRPGGSYPKAPIARQTFSAVPLRAFDLLWHDRQYSGAMEIEVQASEGWTIAMEIIADSTEQVYVRPKSDVSPDILKEVKLTTAFVPPMTGLGTAEPVYQTPKIEQLLGLGRPGEVLRNLLVEANRSGVFEELQVSMQEMFGCYIELPNDTGADILVEYSDRPGGPSFDIACAGSGFQQVLMLVTFLLTRPGSVLLIDEPDAHLHVMLQDQIYSRLRAAAAKTNSQLVIATHSEVIINSVEPSALCMLLDHPRPLETVAERRILTQSLRVLTEVEIFNAQMVKGVLYVEGPTDIRLLLIFARKLNHPMRSHFIQKIMLKKIVSDIRPGAPGIKAKEHYESLTLVRPDLPGLELVDGDARPEIQPTEITGRGLQRLRWKRYEIESYLFHPAALERLVERVVGGGEQSKKHREDLQKYLDATYSTAFAKEPLKDYAFLTNLKARTEILPPALSAAGLINFPESRYLEIAEIMKPEEIHHEVGEKFDLIQQAFGL